MNAQNKKALRQKIDNLHDILARYDALGIAFSGGVDSTLLLAAAVRVLGPRVVAFTAESAVHPSGEKALAVELARELRVRHVLFATDELSLAPFAANGPDRCYHCKRHLIARMQRQGGPNGIRVFAHGANVDDLSDFRPGFKAAGEMGVAAPLIDAGLTKTEIRALAHQLGLRNWARPAMACLATRIPYGTPIQARVLGQIDKAEAVIRRVSGGHCRVRHHGNVARIETDPETVAQMAAPDARATIVRELRALGYDHVSLDLEGYVPGKMNRGKNGCAPRE